MKKLFFLTIFLLFVNFGNSQTINWGLTTKTLESFSYNWYSKSGTYIGNINGFDYYVYYRRAKSSINLSDKINVAFVKVKDNQVIQFTEFIQKDYLKINIQVIENKIGIVYLDLGLDINRDVKIDYIDPDLLTIQKTQTLYSYKCNENCNSYAKFAVSEDKKTFAIMTFAIMSDAKNTGLLIKTFNNDYIEKSETYIADEYKTYRLYEQLFVNNDGSGYVVISDYVVGKDNYYLDYIDIIKFNDSDFAKVKYEEENMYDLNSSYMFQTGKENAKLVLSNNKNFKIIDLDFNSENVEESQSYELKPGNWKIDKVIRLENGNLFFSLANQGMEIFLSSNSRTIVYFNKSYHFYCLDASLDNLIYDVKSGRYYSVNEGIQSPEGYLTVPTFYGYKDNNVTLIYNSDEEYPKKHTEKNGDDDRIITTTATETSLLQKTVIDENGNVKTTVLTNSSDENGIFVTPFIHVTDDGKIIIAKINNKKITFGTIAQ